MNAQHALGYDVNGVAGGDFFTPIAATAGAASLVRIDSAIEADPQLIAAAQSATALPGDNRNVQALADLRTSSQVALGNVDFKDYFVQLVSDVGQQVQTSKDTQSFQKALFDQRSIAQAESNIQRLFAVAINPDADEFLKKLKEEGLDDYYQIRDAIDALQEDFRPKAPTALSQPDLYGMAVSKYQITYRVDNERQNRSHRNSRWWKGREIICLLPPLSNIAF